MKRLIHLLLQPGAVRRESAKAVVRRIDRLPYETRVKFETMPYPQYAYGTYFGALQAKALGLRQMSAVEFGVAGGNGLVALEEIAADVAQATGVEVRVFGFDLGEGMPEAVDYRDLPYVWKKGIFVMEEERLRARLQEAELLLGDVTETVRAFASDRSVPPTGFISFDLDYYSSTRSAFRIFEQESCRFLPRTFCYFDDCVGDDWELHSEFAGELLMIDEFNRDSRHRKLGRINGLRHKRVFLEATAGTWLSSTSELSARPGPIGAALGGLSALNRRSR